ncbi:MAG: hypothetical protein HQK99_15440 [Nitrospirae bacterium]|nr:hypothetical protein [Nitrospirota bacterium]
MIKSAAMVFTVFIVFMMASVSGAAEVREVQLNDGSVITGEIVSYINGVYTVKSATLGTMTINDAMVRSISSKGAAASTGSNKPAGSTQDTATQVKDLERKMMADKDIMNIILSLKEDPDVQKVLEDPEIMKAINRNDVQALMNNQKFLALLNNPKIKEIESKMTK